MTRKPKILVVGSFVMDQIVTTSIFPNSGQTVLGNDFSKAPGGKGANQAVQAARLGAEVTLFGKLGEDSNAEDMLKTCRDAGIDVSRVVRDKDTPSGCSVIILEQSQGKATQNRIIVLSGTNMKITKDDVAFLKEEVANYDLVMLQLEIPMEINELVAKYAYDKGVPVMLNSAPSAPLTDEFLSHLAYISPNEHEAADLTGIEIEHSGVNFNREQAQSAATVLRNKGVKNVLITMGSAGAVLINDDGFFHSPTIAEIKAVDPTAAGDSFVATFCTGICCGWEAQQTLEFANCVATLTVSSKGAMPSLPTLDKAEAFVREHKFTLPDISMLKNR